MPEQSDGLGLGLGLGDGLGLGLGLGLGVGLGLPTTNGAEVSLVPEALTATAVTTCDPTASPETSKRLARNVDPPLKSHGAVLSVLKARRVIVVPGVVV